MLEVYKKMPKIRMEKFEITTLFESCFCRIYMFSCFKKQYKNVLFRVESLLILLISYFCTSLIVCLLVFVTIIHKSSPFYCNYSSHLLAAFLLKNFAKFFPFGPRYCIFLLKKTFVK